MFQQSFKPNLKLCLRLNAGNRYLKILYFIKHCLLITSLFCEIMFGLDLRRGTKHLFEKCKFRLTILNISPRILHVETYLIKNLSHVNKLGK